MEIKFSVIIPVYNAEKFLNRCIDSVLTQSYTNYEIILIDDGSSDNSGSICDEYAEKSNKIKVIHQDNRGISYVRNTGISVASGDYICFIDSDDFVVQDFLKDISNYLQIYKNADIVEFDFCFEKKPQIYELKGEKTVNIIKKEVYVNELLKCIIENQICRRIYKKSLFENISFPVNRIYEDLSVIYKLVLKSDMIIRTTFSYYIYNLTNNNSITKKVDLKAMNDLYNAANEFYDGLKTYCIESSMDMDYLECYKIYQYIYIIYKLYRSKQVENELYKNIRNYLKSNSKIKWKKCKTYNWKKMLVVMTLLKLEIM